MKNNKTRWILVAVVAAIVAAATTALVLILRARAKKDAWYEGEAFDCDLDDCDCFDFEDDSVFSVEEDFVEDIVDE